MSTTHILFTLQLKLHQQLLDIQVLSNDTKLSLVQRICKNNHIHPKYYDQIQQKIMNSLAKVLKQDSVPPALLDKVLKFFHKTTYLQQPSTNKQQLKPIIQDKKVKNTSLEIKRNNLKNSKSKQKIIISSNKTKEKQKKLTQKLFGEEQGDIDEQEIDHKRDYDNKNRYKNFRQQYKQDQRENIYSEQKFARKRLFNEDRVKNEDRLKNEDRVKNEEERKQINYERSHDYENQSRYLSMRNKDINKNEYLSQRINEKQQKINLYSGQKYERKLDQSYVSKYNSINTNSQSTLNWRKSKDYLYQQPNTTMVKRDTSGSELPKYKSYFDRNNKNYQTNISKQNLISKRIENQSISGPQALNQRYKTNTNKRKYKYLQ